MLKTKLSLLPVVGLMGVFIFSPLHVFAQTAIPTTKVGTSQGVRLANLHILADTAVSTRLTDLQTTQTKVSGLVKLSSDQKAQYSNQITANITGLTSLKTKCDADTDLTTLRTDYQSIFTQYRVYAVFLPQIHLLVASDTMGVTTDKLSTYAASLEARVQTAGNPSNLVSLLTDMQHKIADAKTQYSNVESQISPLTPQNYDSNPTGTTSILKNARVEIQTGASDLKIAFSDGNQILQTLKSLGRTSPTSTP